jgi:hypothetical protein
MSRSGGESESHDSRWSLPSGARSTWPSFYSSCHRAHAPPARSLALFFLRSLLPGGLYRLNFDLDNAKHQSRRFSSHTGSHKTATPSARALQSKIHVYQPVPIPYRHSLITHGTRSAPEWSHPPAQLAGSLPVSRPSRKALRASATFPLHATAFSECFHTYSYIQSIPPLCDYISSHCIS